MLPGITEGCKRYRGVPRVTTPMVPAVAEHPGLQGVQVSLQISPASRYPWLELQQKAPENRRGCF